MRRRPVYLSVGVANVLDVAESALYSPVRIVCPYDIYTYGLWASNDDERQYGLVSFQNLRVEAHWAMRARTLAPNAP